MAFRTLLQLLIDALLASAAIRAAYAIRPSYFGPDGELYRLHVGAIALFAFVLLFSSFLMDVYDRSGKPRKREVLVRVLLAGLASCFPISVIYFIAPHLLPAITTVVLGILLFSTAQFCFHALLSFMTFSQRVLVLGTGPLASQIGRIVAEGSRNIAVAGYVTCAIEANRNLALGSPDEVGKPVEPVVGDAADLDALATSLRADTIVVALSERRGVFPVREVLQCKMRGIEILDAPTFYEVQCKKLMLEQITPSWFFLSSGFRRTTVFMAVKRSMDIMLSLIGLILTVPFFPLIALIIKLDSPGPLFFSQIRVGAHEKTFLLYKFRTMRQDAEKGTGAVWSTENDPRITRIGAFLRKSRIDEFPQFYNVLMGSMSFVGPRPERPEFVEKLKQVIPYYSKRHFVKPGLTGWAQVCYPYGSTVEDAVEKLRYDLYYTKNLSSFLDLLIILETIKVVLFGRGGR
jgi:sugar transferase (PEP-CTERM system associated)